MPTTARNSAVRPNVATSHKVSRRVAIAAPATVSSGRTFASGSSGSISRKARRIDSTIDAGSTSALAIRNIGCGYHVCGCGKYSAGAARLCHGMSRTSPITPATFCEAPLHTDAISSYSPGESPIRSSRRARVNSSSTLWSLTLAAASRPRHTPISANARF